MESKSSNILIKRPIATSIFYSALTIYCIQFKPSFSTWSFVVLVEFLVISLSASIVAFIKRKEISNYPWYYPFTLGLFFTAVMLMIFSFLTPEEELIEHSLPLLQNAGQITVAFIVLSIEYAVITSSELRYKSAVLDNRLKQFFAYVLVIFACFVFALLISVSCSQISPGIILSVLSLFRILLEFALYRFFSKF